MCGICGFITRHEIAYDDLKRMNDTMIHRGPNDSGEEIYQVSQGVVCGMAQRRLSILDLSELGHQPMHSPDGSVSIVYNGEIYNYQELKSDLGTYPFRSNCDTEVILAAYLRWGIHCIDRFNGMFAIAIFDRRTDEMYLARDRIGKKPLYYYWNKEEFVFGSELKPIMAYPNFENEINTKIIPRFLCSQYINAPDSIFSHVHKLEPGGILHYRNHTITTWKYWDVAEQYHAWSKKPVQNYAQAKAELKALLKQAVRMRMVADVPIGLFLSGGYDSSLVTAIAQSISDKPVHTYSIGFADEKYNEANYAKEVAKYLGTVHTEHYITEREMLDLVDSIPQYYDEPFADSSQIPSMLVADVAAKDIAVVLTGDGGDEFFCGYNIYETVKLAQRLDFFGNVVYGLCELPFFRGMNFMDRLPFKVRVIAQNHNINTKTQIISGSYVQFANQMVKGEKKPVRNPIEGNYRVQSWQIRRMLLDMDDYLPGDILCKVDRATMKYSVEARCPLLDYQVMEYSYRLPQIFKYKNSNKKRILKELACEYIPKELLDRPKKGFGVPLDSWMRGPLREQLLDFSNREYVKRQGIFYADVVANLVAHYLERGDGGAASGRNYSKILWSFLCFQKWYEKYLL